MYLYIKSGSGEADRLCHIKGHLSCIMAETLLARSPGIRKKEDLLYFMWSGKHFLTPCFTELVAEEGKTNSTQDLLGWKEKMSDLTSLNLRWKSHAEERYGGQYLTTAQKLGKSPFEMKLFWGWGVRMKARLRQVSKCFGSRGCNWCQISHRHISLILCGIWGPELVEPGLMTWEESILGAQGSTSRWSASEQW